MQGATWRQRLTSCWVEKVLARWKQQDECVGFSANTSSFRTSRKKERRFATVSWAHQKCVLPTHFLFLDTLSLPVPLSNHSLCHARWRTSQRVYLVCVDHMCAMFTDVYALTYQTVLTAVFLPCLFLLCILTATDMDSQYLLLCVCLSLCLCDGFS